MEWNIDALMFQKSIFNRLSEHPLNNVLLNSVTLARLRDMSKTASWQDDLLASRDLSDTEKSGFEFVLKWFESWRLGLDLPMIRETAIRFWREAVQKKPREPWQLEHWAAAIRWLLEWSRIGLSPTRFH